MATTNRNRRITLRIPEELAELLDMCVKEQHADQSTVMRQWLYLGAEDYALKRVNAGALSFGRATELLGTTHYDLHNLARVKGIEIGADEQAQELARRVATSVKLTPRPMP
jgi:hypothetical protein